jgi:adenylate kinase family enzyme
MTYSHILVTGASGSGTTTLGRTLAARLDAAYFDTDDYFWLPSDPPYQRARPMPDRLELFQQALSSSPRWVVGGSLEGWGDPLIRLFDLVIWLYAPTDIRLARLRERESARFGAEIEAGGKMHAAHQAFLTWAAGYDKGTGQGRTLRRHRDWLSRLPCRVLRLDGRLSVETLVSCSVG